MSAGGEGEGGNHAGQADVGEGGGGTPAIDCMIHRRLWRRRGRLDQAREGSAGGRG